MMRGLNKFPSTILVFGAVLLVLGFCGILYWKHVETQSVHLQERNFRALTVTSQALANLVANYETVFKSVIEGEPPCDVIGPCPEEHRSKAYVEALLALPALRDVNVTKAAYENEGFAAKFASSIKLTYVHQDRTVSTTRWKIRAALNIDTIMRRLVTEDIFSDVLLADHTGRVLYHHPSMRDPSGFKFEDVSALLHRLDGSGSKDGGAEKGGADSKEGLISKLPLFNEVPIGGISHAIFAQATDLLADRGTAQTVILVGIVPAGPFHADARAIPLNQLLLLAGLVLILFFVLPYVKLRTNVPTERLTPISVVVLMISTVLGTAVLTFGLADIATYRDLEQHLNTQLNDVSEEIRKQFNDDVQRGLAQLAMFDRSCAKGECWNRLHGTGGSHLAQRLCIRMDAESEKNEFFFFQTESDTCVENTDKNNATRVLYPDVKTMFWVGSTGELKVLRSRESHPWKYVKLQERQYVRRILADETFIREDDGQRFWIEPIFSRTTGDNAAVISIKRGTSSDGQNPDRPIVAALEVKLPSVTGVGVPPGMGFAVINQEGQVLFHSDPRRNLRENFLEETDRDGRLGQAIFARGTTQFDGRYWGKDRHFHVTPLFLGKEYIQPPDVYWSLVSYWDTDMLRVLNLHALYSSGVLFFLYAVIASSIGIVGWWMRSRVAEAASPWVWPRSEHLHRYQIVIGLLVISLVAVGLWYQRPHPYPDMLLWGLLPALAAVTVALPLARTNDDLVDDNKTDVSARPSYRRSYALVITMIVLVCVVIPALVIFRVSVDVEWRLLAKFSLFDLERDRKLQAQAVRESYPSTLFHDTSHRGEIRTEFFQKFSDRNRVYSDFPFESCRQERKESRDCGEAPTNVVRRGDEFLIRWLYHIIGRPRIGQSGGETDIFLGESERWQESKRGMLWLLDRSQEIVSPISLHSISSPIPQWLYSLLVFGGIVPLAALRVKKIYVFAAAICALGGLLWFGLVGAALVVLAALGLSALLYGAYYVLPRFAAQRILLLDFPHPSIGSSAMTKSQGIVAMTKDAKPPDGWPPDSWEVFAKEMSALRDVLCLADEPTFREKIVRQDIADDCDIVGERIIQEILERVTQYYRQIWKTCTESQRRSLFNLARDGFLHSRNPDIGSLLKSGLIVADLNLRPMNESFRRFVIRTGLNERLDEDIAQARTGAWFQVWRPIGVGLVLVMVFLVLTQEQYRTITLAFLGVLPALLGIFSQALTAPKKEKEA